MNRLMRVATAALSAVLPAPASSGAAESAAPGCRSGYVCAYGDANWKDGIHYYRATPPGGCTDLTVPIDSVANDTGQAQRIWPHSNCTGINVLISPGGCTSDLSGIIGNHGQTIGGRQVTGPQSDSRCE